VNFTTGNTNIAVIGGGNIGTQFACVCASKGYKVNVFSSKPEAYDGTLEVVDEFDNITIGELNMVTANIKEAVDGCQVIIITHPAFRLKEVADQLLPYVKEDMNICILPGTGGAEFAFRECMKAGATLFGLQRVPTVARLEKYGKRVRCEGLRSELFLASIPSSKAEALSEFMSSLWGIPCTALPNYLSVTLTPSNPILHTTRLCTLFADYEDGKVYERNPLFYGEWNDTSSELLIACDSELQEMLKIMNKLDLHNVRSLKIHYESDTVKEMTKKLCSIKSLHNLASPMKTVDGGWIPDFESRYFTADFPYGLAIIEELAEVLKYDAPNIKSTMDWYRKATGNTNRLDLGTYGIHSLEDIYELY
jgi:Glycerol-3-phosphate dehydrogenase